MQLNSIAIEGVRLLAWHKLYCLGLFLPCTFCHLPGSNFGTENSRPFFEVSYSSSDTWKTS